MSSNSGLFLNNKGAIFALQGEGYSLCQIRCKLDIKRGAQKKSVKELDEHHSAQPVSLAVGSKVNAPCRHLYQVTPDT